MKYRAILLFYVSLMFFVSCVEPDETEEGADGTRSYYFYEDKSLNIVDSEDQYIKWANIKQGENLVFEYYFTDDDDPLIADDEYSESIRFEVPGDVTSFSYSGEDLLDCKITFTPYCFCFFDDEETAENTGTVSGERISDDRWKITVDVVFYGFHKRTFTEFFSAKGM